MSRDLFSIHWIRPGACCALSLRKCWRRSLPISLRSSMLARESKWKRRKNKFVYWFVCERMKIRCFLWGNAIHNNKRKNVYISSIPKERGILNSIQYKNPVQLNHGRWISRSIHSLKNDVVHSNCLCRCPFLNGFFLLVQDRMRWILGFDLTMNWNFYYNGYP